MEIFNKILITIFCLFFILASVFGLWLMWYCHCVVDVKMELWKDIVFFISCLLLIGMNIKQLISMYKGEK